MEKHTVGVKGDVDVAKERLSEAGIEITEDHPNFVEADVEPEQTEVAAIVEAETLEDAVDLVRAAVLTDGAEDDFNFFPVSEKHE